MPNSLPALVAGILQSDKVWNVRSAAWRFGRTPLVPAYQIDDELPRAEQATRAAQVLAELTQKLTRLEEAYPNWSQFEPGPYFDLDSHHLGDFCRFEETSTVVRARLYVDLLLPAFRRAERYWVESFLPAFHAGQTSEEADVFHEHLTSDAFPTLAALVAKAEQVIEATLHLVEDDLEILTHLGGLEERIQHRPPPGTLLASELPPALQRLPREMPTLTLDVMFARSSRAPQVEAQAETETYW